jgi:hypothetical protein
MYDSPQTLVRSRPQPLPYVVRAGFQAILPAIYNSISEEKIMATSQQNSSDKSDKKSGMSAGSNQKQAKSGSSSSSGKSSKSSSSSKDSKSSKSSGRNS